MSTPLKIRIEPYLDDIKARKVTVKAVAAELHVGYWYLSHVLNQIGGQPAPGQRALDRKLTQARKEYRQHLAQTMSIEDAARAAKCHPRTIKRLLERIDHGKP